MSVPGPPRVPLRLHVFLSVVPELFIAVLTELQQSIGDIEVTATAWHPEVETMLRRSGLRVIEVHRLWETIADAKRSREPVDLEQLVEFETVVHPHTLWETVVADSRFNGGWPRDRILRTVSALGRTISELFDAHTPDLLLMDGVACLPSYLNFSIARSRGIPPMMIQASRTPGRVFITQSEIGLIDQLPVRLAEIRERGLEPEEAAAAQQFLDDFRTSRVRPTIAALPRYSRRPSISFEDGRRLLDHARRYRRLPEPYVFYGSPASAIKSRVLRIARDLLSRRFFEPPRRGEKFVLYPLHYEPEAAILVSAPYSRDQRVIVDQIATALPIDHLLYVKEHPSSIGRRELSYYRELKRHRNVRLIDPLAESHALIEASSAVVTINGTMGWEAALLHKPVLTVGDVFYNLCPGVTRVMTVDGFPRALRDVLNEQTLHAEDALVEFVAAYLQATTRGEFQLPIEVPAVLSPGNIRRLTDALTSRCGMVTELDPAVRTR